jgi:hypothetical protein
MSDHRTEQDLGVLLGLRNTLDRFLEILDAQTMIEQNLELTLRKPHPPLRIQTAELRTELQGIIDRWPKARPPVPVELHLRCKIPECLSIIPLQPRATTATQDDYLRDNGWAPDGGGAFCPEHTAQIDARRRAQHIEAEGRDLRAGKPPTRTDALSYDPNGMSPEQLHAARTGRPIPYPPKDNTP